MKKNNPESVVSDVDTAMRQLEELAETFGLQIRQEPIKGEDELPIVRGGMCRLKGDRVLIINSNVTTLDKIRTLAGALKQFDLDRVYIRPALRELLERGH